MRNTRWHDSLPPPQPTRHRVRARQDFEDSITADRLETLAHPGLAMVAKARAPRSRIVMPPADDQLKAALSWGGQPKADASRRHGGHDDRAHDARSVQASLARPRAISGRQVAFFGAAVLVGIAAWGASLSLSSFL